MKNLYLNIIFWIILPFMLSCSDEHELEIIEDTPLPIPYASDFTRVAWDYELKINGINYVNTVSTVNSKGGSHWTFLSPYHQNQEIGFSVVADPSCISGDCEVILFLHGSNGSENSGATLFYTYYEFFQSDQPKVMIFANGILADDDAAIPTGVWKQRTSQDSSIIVNPLASLYELIGGLITTDDPQLSFINKEIGQWSALGFSAGASPILGMYLDDLFTTSDIQPQRLFHFGGWLSNDHLQQYFDFSLDNISSNICSAEVPQLIIATHEDDDVDCVGSLQINTNKTFMDYIEEQQIPYMFWTLREEMEPLCKDDGNGNFSNRTHNVDFFLRNKMNTTLRTINCIDFEQSFEEQNIGDLLYLRE